MLFSFSPVYNWIIFGLFFCMDILERLPHKSRRWRYGALFCILHSTKKNQIEAHRNTRWMEIDEWNFHFLVPTIFVDEPVTSRMALWKGDMQLHSLWPRRISWTRWKQWRWMKWWNDSIAVKLHVEVSLERHLSSFTIIYHHLSC